MMDWTMQIHSSLVTTKKVERGQQMKILFNLRHQNFKEIVSSFTKPLFKSQLTTKNDDIALLFKDLIFI